MIHIVTPDLAYCYRDELRAMHRLRYRVFKQRMKWDVEGVNGEERDHFDDLGPTYVLGCDGGDDVVGSIRLLPTTGPYMLRNVFSELLDDAPAPGHPLIWESSRFAVDCAVKGKSGLKALSRLSAELFCGALEHCLANGIREMVMVYDSRVARVFDRMGGPVSDRPIWRSSPRPIGNTIAYAASWKVDEGTLEIIRERNDIHGSVLAVPKGRPAFTDRVAA